MKEHIVETRHVLMAPWRYLVSTTEEQRGYGQKDQDLVFNEFNGNDTNARGPYYPSRNKERTHFETSKPFTNVIFKYPNT
jgi:hypothetical protein